MARINYPDDFAGQNKLFNAILKQNTSLGAKSPLIPYCKEQEIDLTKLQGLIKPAGEQDDSRLALERSSENNTQQRDAKFAPVWKNFIGAVQFLKQFYRSNERKLGDWFITVDGISRIVYPPDFAARAKLVQDFYGKHNGYPPGESPLQMYLDEHSIDVTADLNAVSKAIQSNDDKDTQEAASQAATQQRNTIWQPVVDAIHAFGGFLMGLYRDDSRKMGVWGYEVVEDAARRTERKTKLLPGEKRTLNTIIIGSSLYNTGKTELQIYKGKTIEGEGVILKPGNKMGILKGYSVITVINLSTLEEGNFLIEFMD